MTANRFSYVTVAAFFLVRWGQAIRMPSQYQNITVFGIQSSLRGVRELVTRAPHATHADAQKR
jgi:hypothetical protein